MKKLRLELENISVESFEVGSEAGLGTVRGNNDDPGAVAGGGTFLSLCPSCPDTCPATCNVAAATCGASCGVACRHTVNSPDCWVVIPGVPADPSIG
jgi:hypothetical protein